MTLQLETLHKLTLKIAQRIDNTNIEELLSLVQLRDDAIESLNAKSIISEVEQSLLQQIRKEDDLILSRMTALKDEAAEGLNKIAKIRIQKKTYEKMYAGDSYFFDKKE
ncbi:hypothetical protein [Paenibacillus paridis]|uniref:hypothetical protein n=1 Tax=Paenibacillus paridis TaxID=2583376 RepID=UPI001120F423|nr:hypothetical protein [Paenibacillus paridis]